MKSLTLRVLGAAAVTAALLTVPATAFGSVQALPFRLVVPGASATGAYEATRLTVTVKVTGRHTCGILQLRSGGGEWDTAGALCRIGTAAIRTEVSAAALPAIRLCNGDSLALAEGVDCDDHAPGAVTTAG